jgi:hypothetical protein
VKVDEAFVQVESYRAPSDARIEDTDITLRVLFLDDE